MSNKKLFDNSDNEEDCTLKTNTSYAKHYDEFRKKEILSHLKNLSDESDSSDDASTDEELVNPEFDKEFLKSLAFLKSKDPKKYEAIPNFFENIPTVEDTIKDKKKKSQKPVTVADYQRERLIATEGRMSEDEDEQPTNGLSYNAEQEKIKSDLKKVLEESSDEDDGLFQVRDKPREEQEKEEQDYLKWLAGQKKEVNIGDDAKTLKPLKDFWTSNDIPKADKFLRDYIVNKRYVGNEHVVDEHYINLSDDEQEVEKQAEFEQKYNFRFEEPDTEFIKRFPRTVDDSVRAIDNRRKEKRKERDERKAMEKEVKMKDLRQFQNIKKREIEQKLMMLKEVAGNDDFAYNEDELDSDFDPAEHDRRMTQMFNNEYYGIDEGDQKPEFPDIDVELNIENWDNFDKSKVADTADADPHCEDDDFIMDCDYDPEQEKKKKMQDELIEMSKGRKRRKKISKLAEIIKKEKPVYDPSTTEKTYEEYLDEYYKLDYEDIIGDQPCRFRYTECVANDFGLTVEEILMASNKELNQWASLKKTMQNRPKNVEANDVEKYNRRRNNVALKKKIFASIYGQPESDEGEASGDDQLNVVEKALEQLVPKPAIPIPLAAPKAPETVTSDTQAKKKTKKKKKKAVATEEPIKSPAKSKPASEVKSPKVKPTPPATQTTSEPKQMKRKLETSPAVPKNAKKMKFNKNKDKKLNNDKKTANGQPKNDLSDNRLKAFGINPKKFKNKIKYNGKNNTQGGNNKKPFQKKHMMKS